jgi:hypothetical protein
MSGGMADVVNVPIFDFQSRQLLLYEKFQPHADLTNHIYTLPDGRVGKLYVADKLRAQEDILDKCGILFSNPFDWYEWGLFSPQMQRVITIDAIRNHSETKPLDRSGPYRNLKDMVQGLVDNSAGLAMQLGRYTFYIDPTDRLMAFDSQLGRELRKFDPTMHDQFFFKERSSSHTEPFDVVVKTLTGRSVTIRVSPDNFIYQLKLMIQDKEGIPTDQQRLIVNHKQMEDTDTVGARGIGENDTLHLVLRLSAGPNSIYLTRRDYDEAYIGEHSSRIEWGYVDVAVLTCDGRKTTVSISQRLDADDLKRQIANLNRLCKGGGVSTGGRSSSSDGDSFASRSCRNPSSPPSGGRDVALRRPAGWRRP